MAPRDPQAPPIIEEEWASFALGTISWFGYWFLHVCKRYGRSRDANIWLDRKFRCSMAPVVTVIRWGSFCWGDLFPNVRFLKRLPIYLNEIFETSDHLFRSDARANLKVRNLPFTLRMSQDYRFYDDRWQSDRSVEDEPLDMSAEFEASQEIMAEIAAMISSQGILPNDIEKLISVEMTKVALGSNKIERLGLGLDETFRLCLAVFEGGQELEIMDREEEYQTKLDAFVLKTTNPGEKAVIRSRREVVQHAAAFQHIVNAYVKHEKPLSENLIRETHAILVRGINAEEAGVFSSKNFGGTYRRQEAYTGALRYTKASEVPKAMKSLVSNLQSDIEAIERSGTIDPFMLAAKYCDRFVNVHPFKDGNGRMCRLILNAMSIFIELIVRSG